MRPSSLILVIIASFLVFFQTQAQVQDIRVNHLWVGEQNTEGANSIAILPNGIFILWADNTAGLNTYVSRSRDGGASFEDGIKVGGNTPNLLGGLATDDQGTIYTIWNEVIGENLAGILFSKSSDGGISFSTPLEIVSEGLLPEIRVYGSMIYISFFQFLDNQKTGLFFTRSVDGGESFSLPIEITDTSLNIDQIKLDTPHSLSLDALGTVYCTWNDGRRGDGGTDIYVAVSTDQGSSFGPNVRINSTANPDMKIRTGSMVGAFDNYVFAVWRQDDDQSGSGRRIMYSYSSDHGSTFSDDQELATGGFGSPHLTITPKKRVLITYPHIFSGKQGLYFTILDDELQEFSDPVLLNATHGESKYQSAVVSASDTLYATWTGNQGDDNDVFFTRTYIGPPPVIRDFDLIIGDQEEVIIPANNPWGLMHMPDGEVSYMKQGNEVKMWIATGRSTTQLIGPDLDHLTPFPLDYQGKAGPVLEPSTTGFDSTYAGAYSVIPAYNGQDLLMFYHGEKHPCSSSYDPAWFGIGLARSNDGGTIWQKKGQILTSILSIPKNPCGTILWGLGTPTVYYSPDKKYLYMLYFEVLRDAPYNNPDGFYLARAPIESDGEPGSWEKYRNGNFSESGLGGLGSLVINPPNGRPYGFQYNFAAGPSVSFNTFLNLYVLVFQSKVGLHVATSEDGIRWSTPELAWEVPESSNTNNEPSVAYFCLISPDQPSQLTTSQTGYLYFARMYPNWDPPTTMSRRSFEIKPRSSSAPKTNSTGSRPILIQNYPNPFHDNTTFGFIVPVSGNITLRVYDQSGRMTSLIYDGFKEAGYHEINWEAPKLRSGIYFYQITTSTGTFTRKMVIQKLD